MPERYVGAVDAQDDGELFAAKLFAAKMARLTAQSAAQFAKSDLLEAQIKQNPAGLGYDI